MGARAFRVRYETIGLSQDTIDWLTGHFEPQMTYGEGEIYMLYTTEIRDDMPDELREFLEQADDETVDIAVLR